MKLTNTLKPLLILCCLVFSHQVMTQNYTIPSQELVDGLLLNLKNCKVQIDLYQELIKEIEDNPDAHSLGQYNRAKEYLTSHKRCVQKIRGQLDKLRKDYPEWFNSPSTTIPIDKEHYTTPSQLENELSSLEANMDAIMKHFRKIKKPEK